MVDVFIQVLSHRNVNYLLYAERNGLPGGNAAKNRIALLSLQKGLLE